MKFLNDRFRRLDGDFLQARNICHRLHDRRRGFSRRFRVIFAGRRNRVVEVLDIEPFLGTYAVLDAVLPQLGGLDIEFSLLLLVASLDAVAGDGPLSAHPIDVAMQDHLFSVISFPERLSPRAKTKNEDTATRRLRNSEGAACVE